MLNITHPEIERYLDSLLPQRDAVFIEMEKYADKEGFPAVGPQVGALLALLVNISGASKILELGSGFGYSAMWMAKAMTTEGIIILTDESADFKKKAAGYFEKIGLSDRIEYKVGNSIQIMTELTGPFDLIFNDIDKEDYPAVIDLAYPRLRKGGILVTDNTLWYGHVVSDEPDETTRAILKHNDVLTSHSGFFTVQLPLRDGLSVSVKL